MKHKTKYTKNNNTCNYRISFSVTNKNNFVISRMYCDEKPILFFHVFNFAFFVTKKQNYIQKIIKVGDHQYMAI